MSMFPLTDGYSFAIPGLLAIGSRPDANARLSKFNVLVLCAEEYQPERRFFLNKHVTVLYVPLPDGLLSPNEINLSTETAEKVSTLVKARCPVLVTCWQGRNRSGLVTALALMNLGKTADEAIEMVRSARGNTALTNMFFVDLIHRQSFRKRTT